MNLNLKHLRLEFKKYRKESKTLAIRLSALIALAKRRSQFAASYSELDFCLVSKDFKISSRTLQRWLSSYFKNGILGLKNKIHSNRSKILVNGWTAAKITEYRLLYNWGAETIQAHLALDHQVLLSKYRINVFLREKKLLKKRRRKKLKNRHTTVVVVETPGAHTQTDVKHLPRILSNKKKTYVYNFVDHASRWEYKEAFDSFCPWNTVRFFKNVIAHAPFKILCSQTDNGVEFTNKFISHLDNPRLNFYEEFLQDKQIKHRLIPPGEKELNGLVERSHRADDEELYHRTRVTNLKEFNKVLKAHCQWRNDCRRKKPLGWLTSTEWLWKHEAAKTGNHLKFANTG